MKRGLAGDTGGKLDLGIDITDPWHCLFFVLFFLLQGCFTAWRVRSRTSGGGPKRNPFSCLLFFSLYLSIRTRSNGRMGWARSHESLYLYVLLSHATKVKQGKSGGDLGEPVHLEKGKVQQKRCASSSCITLGIEHG